MEEHMHAHMHICTYMHAHTSQRGSSSHAIQSKQEADMNLLRGFFTEEQIVAKLSCHQLRV